MIHSAKSKNVWCGKDKRKNCQNVVERNYNTCKDFILISKMKKSFNHLKMSILAYENVETLLEAVN